ncbi:MULTISPECIES: hypothetical protein [Eikenella]|uniref:Uncharacterized protein n=1 Tax=Eikenella longinqua TaxID=1795827 RepID=A0A1A9RWZ3_9NEIS|nr:MULTISPECIES: hypothetical protein [Eikenella]OAM29229.1 hypothetical protein A7P95_04610 [Eikenella longinqua]
MEEIMHTKKRLIMLSLALYLLSLCLPSLGEQPGVAVLMAGIVFGWMGIFTGKLATLAAYANVFYLWSVVRMLEGRQPRHALNACMVLSLFTFPFMLGANPFSDIGAVGWGVLVWLAALWLPWAAGMTGEESAGLRRAAAIWVSVSAVMLLAAFAYGRWQSAALTRDGIVQDWPAGTVFVSNNLGKYAD